MAKDRSIIGPIAITSVAVLLMLALVVGWTLIWIASDQTTWLLVLGLVSLAMVIVTLLFMGITIAIRAVQERRQSRFLDSVSHELKSPLASMRLCIDALGNSTLAPEKIGDVKQMLSEDVERLTSFIDDIIVANKMDTPKIATSIEEVELAPFIHRCFNKVVISHRENKTLDCRVPDGEFIWTDPTLLELLVKNVLDNAFKYSNPGSTVVIESQSLQDRTTITVVDSGIGIVREELKKVMRRFYRATDSETRKRVGTGLGLYVAKNAAKRLGGKLTLDSPGPMKGTIAKITLESRQPEGMR